MKFYLSSAIRLAVLGSLLFVAGLARADWHTGVVNGIYSGYDGSALTFTINGWSPSNCTCYTLWPSHMCLIRSRTSFKDEYALLLLSKASGTPISINIDETTCFVSAIGSI